MPDFKDREKALENEYIRKREAEKAAAYKSQQQAQSSGKSAPTTNPATSNSAQVLHAPTSNP
ncbi:hypothetical protein PV08_02957 [Exophiala spinifera]|uniref:Uncharacterized protein n=1 Tax=Exophiala spinifera TaxID=91928 RepID=A0A0D2BI79_9EURO|nr:uncharacterized protein PV08_02957 [Exophiala spinifera]KIW18668.1 hypothetical protein PV08_02957 [Exophiala spinifera]